MKMSGLECQNQANDVGSAVMKLLVESPLAVCVMEIEIRITLPKPAGARLTGITRNRCSLLVGMEKSKLWCKWKFTPQHR